MCAGRLGPLALRLPLLPMRHQRSLFCALARLCALHARLSMTRTRAVPGSELVPCVQHRSEARSSAHPLSLMSSCRCSSGAFLGALPSSSKARFASLLIAASILLLLLSAPGLRRRT